MCKQIKNLDGRCLAFVLLVATWPLCWLLVYKLDARYVIQIGRADVPLSAIGSFVTYLLLSNALLAAAVWSVFVFRRAVRGDNAGEPDAGAKD